MAKEDAGRKDEGKKTDAPVAAAPARAGKSGAKVAMLVLLVVVLEAATVGVTMMLSGGPKTAEGQVIKPDAQAEEGKQLVELKVIHDQFPNQRTGRTYLYDTEIWVVVHQKDADKVKKMIDAMQAAISADVAVIFRQAEPAQLLEPTLATLTRQIKACLDARIGKDADGNPIVQQALITKCIQFRADG